MGNSLEKNVSSTIVISQTSHAAADCGRNELQRESCTSSLHSARCIGLDRIGQKKQLLSFMIGFFHFPKYAKGTLSQLITFYR